MAQKTSLKAITKKKNDKVILIEDVTSTGGSVKESAQILESQGLIVSQIITIFSRATSFNLEYNNIPIEYLYHKDDLQEQAPISPISIASTNTNSISSSSLPTSSITSMNSTYTLQEIIKEKKNQNLPCSGRRNNI